MPSIDSPACAPPTAQARDACIDSGRSEDWRATRSINPDWFPKEINVRLLPGRRFYYLRRPVSSPSTHIALLIPLGFSLEASSAARRGLADGSFRKVDVTPRVRDAFNHATESALEVYYISSDEE
jgi:hypothetical protein